MNRIQSPSDCVVCVCRSRIRVWDGVCFRFIFLCLTIRPSLPEKICPVSANNEHLYVSTLKALHTCSDVFTLTGERLKPDWEFCEVIMNQYG